MRVMITVLISLLFVSTAFAPDETLIVTASWTTPTTITICSTQTGELWRLVTSDAGYWIGVHPGGCVTYPPPDALIDARYAPASGDRWCVRTSTQRACAEPLPLPKRYRVILVPIYR